MSTASIEMLSMKKPDIADYSLATIREEVSTA
jgi:hypothetical protein